MKKVVISGTGVYTPRESISNDELVACFNEYVRNYNQAHASEIARGQLEALAESSAEFIVKASGIKNRHVMDKAGILNLDIMCPQIPARPDEEISIQAEMAIAAAKQALINANKTAAEIDAVILSCTNTQRPYPSVAIEVQNALGTPGYAYDMSVACSSVTFGMQAAFNSIIAGQAKAVLLINPELATPQIDFRDRETHFIFGDVATAMVIEAAATCQSQHAFEVVGVKLKTQFSNNIRCNFGYLDRVEEAAGTPLQSKLFTQQGRKVFREVIPMVEEFIAAHLAEHGIAPLQLKRLWLHQANINMNRLIGAKILGRDPSETEAPVILDEYANTGSGGVAIVFHQYHQDMQKGDLGILCSFGAGYSIGNFILKKL